MARRILIGYRTPDEREFAERLLRRLREIGGVDAVILDARSPPIGQNFRSFVVEQAALAELIVVIVGPDRQAVEDRHAPEVEPGFLDLLLEHASDGQVVPIFIAGAAPPSRRLAPRLEPLVPLHGLSIRDPASDAELERMISRLLRRWAVAPNADSSGGGGGGSSLPHGNRWRDELDPDEQEGFLQGREPRPSQEGRGDPAAAELLEIRNRTRVDATGPQPDRRRPKGLFELESVPPILPAPPMSAPSRYDEADEESSEPMPNAAPSVGGPAPLLRYLAAVLLAGAAVYLLSRKGLLEFLVPASLGAAGPGRRPAEAKDIDMSVFAPASCCKGEFFLLQVLFHEPQAPEVPSFALRSDPTASLRAAKTLLLPLDLGDRVQLIVAAGGCEIEDASDTIVWRGDTTSASFPVRVPADRAGDAVPVTVRAFREGEPIGRISFSLPVRGTAAATSGVVGDEARRYRQTFFSYASQDRSVVVRYTHAWALLKMRFFQDFLSLDPGERWERRLYEEIDRSDLFLLFWSTNARRSQYVCKEAEYALARRAAGQELDILPVVIEGPPCPAPPDSLAEIHFNDRHSYVVKAVMDEAAARSPN